MSQQLAALLVRGNVRPCLVIDCAAGSTCLTTGKELPWGEAFLPPPSLCLFLSLCVGEHELSPIFYLYKDFGGRQTTGSRSFTLVVCDEEALSSCSTTFVGDFGFPVRFCSRAHLQAWALLWGGTLVPPVWPESLENLCPGCKMCLLCINFSSFLPFCLTSQRKYNGAGRRSMVPCSFLSGALD